MDQKQGNIYIYVNDITLLIRDTCRCVNVNITYVSLNWLENTVEREFIEIKLRVLNENYLLWKHIYYMICYTKFKIN